MSDAKQHESVMRFRIYEGSAEEVLFDQTDGDRFVLSIQEVVNACRAFSRQQDLSKQGHLLLKKLAEWSYQHRDSIRFSGLTIRDSGLLFVVVQRERAFDQELCDRLVELDLSIADDPELDLIHLDVLAVPSSAPEAIAAFASLEAFVEHAD